MVSSWPSVQPPNKAGHASEKRLKNWDLVKNQGSAIMLVLLDYAWSAKQAFSYRYPSGEKGEGYEQSMLGYCSGINRAGHISCPEGYCLGSLGFLGGGTTWHVADTSFGVANRKRISSTAGV